MFFFYGAPGRIRTCDLPVRSRALYPLSYKRVSRILLTYIYYHNQFELSRGYGGKITDFFVGSKKGQVVGVDKNPVREYNHPIIIMRGRIV